MGFVIQQFHGLMAQHLGEIMEKSMALFLATLLHSGTNTHFFHWATKSYAKHKALGHFYESIIEATDQLAETYFGIYGQITQFPATYHQPKEPLAYMQSLQSFVKDARQDLPQDSEIVQLIDNIAQEIDTTIYLLKFKG
jgi:DNA-binding ferritin-like protein